MKYRQLTENFNEKEFACSCCGTSIAHHPLILALQELREKIGQPIHVNSGYRCRAHNTRIGGHRYSRHLIGYAADISVAGMEPVQVAEMAKQIELFNSGTIGCYHNRNFCHLDVFPRGKYYDNWELPHNNNIGE